MELIYTIYKEKLAESIKEEEQATQRWVKLESQYQDSGFTLRFTKYKQFIYTTIANSDNNVETYYTNIRSRARELKKINAVVDEQFIVVVLLNNVGKKFTQFVHRIVASQDEIPDFNKIVTMLYKEDRLLKTDTSNIAIATAMKRYKKELEDEKSSGKGNLALGRGGNTSRGGRGGRGGNNGNNNDNTSGGNRYLKNPNNVNYKGDGDLPECTKYTPNTNGKLKKYWLYDYQTLYKDRILEKYQNNKPKANKATKRKDDFKDNNSTYFSAIATVNSGSITIAIIAIYERRIKEDDEYQGQSVMELTEKPNIQSLE